MSLPPSSSALTSLGWTRCWWKTGCRSPTCNPQHETSGPGFYEDRETAQSIPNGMWWPGSAQQRVLVVKDRAALGVPGVSAVLSGSLSAESPGVLGSWPFKQQAPGLVSLIPAPQHQQVQHWLRNWFKSVCVCGELCRPFSIPMDSVDSRCSSLCLKTKQKRQNSQTGKCTAPP